MKCNGFAYLPVKKVDRVQIPHRLQWKNKPNAKAAVLKTASNHVKVVCGLESHFFL